MRTGDWTFVGVLVEARNPHPRRVHFYLAGATTSREAAVEIILAEDRRLIDLQSDERPRQR